METTMTDVAHATRCRTEVTLLPTYPMSTGRIAPSVGFAVQGAPGFGALGLAVRADVRIDDALPGARSWSPPV